MDIFDFLNNDISLFSKRVSKLKSDLDSKEISNFLGRSDEDLSDLYANYYNFIAS